MDLLQIAVLLGILEGATEFIPVSSTGHLILAQHGLGFVGAKANGFIVVIQLGAILAVVWLYRRKLFAAVSDWRRDEPSRRLLLNLVIGTLPAVVIGLPTEDWIEARLFKPVPVAIALVIGGLAILIVEKFKHPSGSGTYEDVSPRMALGIGFFQVLAILFPGVSRAAATILGGMILGLPRTAATEFSFFLAIPALLGAAAVKLVGMRDILGTADLPLFAVGLLASFGTALAVIQILLRYVARHSFAPFAWYRIALGAAILWFAWERQITF